MAQSAALAEKFHYMCYALATYGQAAVAIFHFLREGKKLCVWGWFVRPNGILILFFSTDRGSEQTAIGQ